MSFKPGDHVEWDSAYDRKKGTTPQRGDDVIRGVYVKRVDDTYSDVSVGGRKPLGCAQRRR
jgi:hypothetical protein